MKLKVSESFIAGSVSGGVTRIVTAPLDVLKVRLQLQLEPLKAAPSSKYSGMVNAARTIFREEGIKAFWKGFIPGEGLYIIYGATQFFTYEKVKDLLQTKTSYSSVRHSIGIDFISGCLAGTTATLISFPFDVIRTRMIGQGEPKVYLNIFHAMRMMYLENGMRTFYRGLNPALLSVAPQCGLVFSSYKTLSYLWDSMMEGKKVRRDIRSVTCGALSGIITKVTLMPLDLPKKRLEVQGFEKARVQFGSIGHYRGLVDCLIKVYNNEGFFAFYKGASPTILKAAMGMSVTFTVYEGTRNFLRNSCFTT